MPYTFEKNELLKLLMQAYEEGNCGFLDLAESVADRLIEENEVHFIPDPQIAESKLPNVFFAEDITLTDNGLPSLEFDNFTASYSSSFSSSSSDARRERFADETWLTNSIRRDING